MHHACLFSPGVNIYITGIPCILLYIFHHNYEILPAGKAKPLNLVNRKYAVCVNSNFLS